MASSKCALLSLATSIAATLVTSIASAQSAQGFAVERFYPSAPGGGWFVMDDLSMHGSLSGAGELTFGYAHGALRVTDGSHRLSIVSEDAVADLGVAIGFDRVRLSMNITSPLLLEGQSGGVGGAQFAAPGVDFGSRPDLISDLRFGTDVRFFGGPTDVLRLGVGAQLIVPNGNTFDYDTDGTFRAMLRVLAAGDSGIFTYAAHLGVHVRPRDDSAAIGPHGSELLFGAAGGIKLALPRWRMAQVVIGPELYGESALRSLLDSTTTGFEGLVTTRIEGTGDKGIQMRVKVASGGGLNAQFGAPEWRMLVGFEAFDR